MDPGSKGCMRWIQDPRVHEMDPGSEGCMLWIQDPSGALYGSGIRGVHDMDPGSEGCMINYVKVMRMRWTKMSPPCPHACPLDPFLPFSDGLLEVGVHPLLPPIPPSQMVCWRWVCT